MTVKKKSYYLISIVASVVAPIILMIYLIKVWQSPTSATFMATVLYCIVTFALTLFCMHKKGKFSELKNMGEVGIIDSSITGLIIMIALNFISLIANPPVLVLGTIFGLLFLILGYKEEFE